MVYRTDWDTSKELFKNVLRDIYDSTDRKAIVEYKEVTKQIPTSDDFEREMYLAGLDYAGQVNEGVDIPLQDPLYGGTKDFTQVMWGTGFKITERMKIFNKYKRMQWLTRQLAMVMKETKDVTVANIYNFPTATTYAAGFDAKALAHATHDLINGTTYSNKTTSGLSLTTLQTAYIYFDTLKDDRGHVFYVRPNKLVVHSNNQIIARQLVGTPKVPYSFENTINIAPDWDLKVFVYHRMTDTNDWFLLASDHEDFGPRVYSSIEPDMKIFDSPDTSRDTVVTSRMYFTYGFTDPKLVYCGIV